MCLQGTTGAPLCTRKAMFLFPSVFVFYPVPGSHGRTVASGHLLNEGGTLYLTTVANIWNLAHRLPHEVAGWSSFNGDVLRFCMTFKFLPPLFKQQLWKLELGQCFDLSVRLHWLTALSDSSIKFVSQSGLELSFLF